MRKEDYRSGVCKAVFAAVLCLSFAGQARAGQLDDFEEGLKRRSDPPPVQMGPGSGSGSNHSSDCIGIFDCALQMLFDQLWYGMDVSVSDDGQRQIVMSDYQPRTEISANFLETGENLYAADLRLGMHGASMGVNIRYTEFHERNPADQLGITQVGLEILPNLGHGIRLGMGFGVYELVGNTYNSGPSVSFPMRLYSFEHVRMEFNPVFADINGNRIDDFDLNLSYVIYNSAFTLGYRYIQSPGSILRGPYVGYVLHW